MNYKELTGKSIKEGFEKFNAKNPHIYKAFEAQVLKAIEKGRTKISAKLVINWIRWSEFLKTDDLNFSINDAFQSYYARHFVEKNPEHANIFDFRKLRNEVPGPYMKVEDNGQICFL